MAPQEMTVLASDRHVKEFSPFSEPAYRVEPGEWIRVETLCASSGAVKETVRAASNEELYAQTGWVLGMPMTGPIYVEGAEPGDALAVYIDEIITNDSGWTVAQPGRGAAGELIDVAEVRVLPIRDGAVDFGFNVHLPLTPMIGAIGTAPKDRAYGSGIPEAHGGNLDCTLIRPKSTLYLPVNVPGALLGLGDLHAVMGDGEVGMAGLEVSGSVIARLGLIKKATMPLPAIDIGTSIAVIVSAPDLDEAARRSVQEMVKWIAAETELGINDANMLVSLVGDVRICQIVDPLMTCRLEMPSDVLASIGITLPNWNK
ncbi:MAG TPA: acetamidase/formamidase family protein [Nitrolancea sp.]|nr:acetamidase/formamidase family protein [Nitrolancea sp.]